MGNDINNCTNCMFSEYSKVNIHINDLVGCDNSTCVNEKSPYYKELVNENYSCRSFLDSVKYFKNKDRKDKLDNLKNPKNNLDF